MATCFGRPNWHNRFRRINDELYPTTGKDEVTDTSYPIFNKELKGSDKFIYHIPGFNFLWGLVFARHTYNIDSQHKDDTMKAAAEVLGVLSALLLSVIAGGLGSVSEEELRRTNHFFDDGMYGCISETPGVRDPVTYSKFLIDYGLVAMLLCFYSLIASVLLYLAAQTLANLSSREKERAGNWMTFIFLADLVCLIIGCILTSYFFRSFLIVKNPQTGIEAICERTTYVPNGLKSPVLGLDVYNCSTPEEPERCYIGARRFMGIWKYFYYGNDTSSLWDDSVYFSGITFTVFVAGAFASFWWLGYTWYYAEYYWVDVNTHRRNHKMKEEYTKYSHLWQPSVIDNDGNVIKDGVFTWDTLNYLADNPVVLDSFLKDVLEREYTKQQQLKRKRDKGLNRGESIAELAQIRAQMACLISDRDFLYEVHVKEGVKWEKKARDNRSRSNSTSSLSSLVSGLGARFQGRSRPSSSSTEHTEVYGFDESVEMEEIGGITGART